jgi:hypothetical protein
MGSVAASTTWLFLAPLGACADARGVASLDRDGSADASASDASVADGPMDGDGSFDAAPRAKLLLVNGSPNAPALRFCFGSGDPTVGGTTLAAVPAEPDDDLASGINGLPYPGVFPGSGAPAPDPGADWSVSSVAIYAIDAERIRSQVKSEDASQANCRALLGADGGGGLLKVNADYWYLGSIPKGTMLPGTSWLSALVGCLPGIAEAGPPCDEVPEGSAPGMGALWELDNSTVIEAGAFGVQFANASFAAAGATPFGTAGLELQAAGGGGTVRIPIAASVGPGALQPSSLESVAGVTFDGSSAFFFSAQNADGGSIDIVGTLPAIQQATWGTSPPDGAAFATGNGFVFVLVGDPTRAADGSAGPSSQAGHLLGFPTATPFGSP